MACNHESNELSSSKASGRRLRSKKREIYIFGNIIIRQSLACLWISSVQHVGQQIFLVSGVSLAIRHNCIKIVRTM